MSFLPAELIRKKRFGGTHTPQEIEFLIQGYAKEEIPDYQMAAWLMAVCFSGMTAEETAHLTKEMRDSGQTLDLSYLGVTVDKHSTGGIGDKTSLLLAPIVASLGIPVPMMAGRGLAHTGGTLDKLESIAGFNVAIGFDRFKQQLGKVGAAIIGQTREVCPADRKLYALRDVTGTVDSYPLICGSIMSKKLAEGMSALVLDVKAGSGAFMKTPDDARGLAKALMAIGKHFDKKVTALITRMDEPLGRFVGNVLEVRECIEILQGKSFAGEGKGYDDTVELTLELASHMIVLGGKASSLAAGRALASRALSDGSALRKFKEIVLAQGGAWPETFPEAPHQEFVKAESEGFLRYTDLEKMGLACVHLGAGRAFQTDPLDHSAGLEIYCVNGQAVSKGQKLFKVHSASPEKFQAALPLLIESFVVSKNNLERTPLIHEVLT
jgi:pyrimidine-nucleoside phosphorylase